jgi:hypothetical protein
VKPCNTRLDPGVDLGEQCVPSLLDLPPQAEGHIFDLQASGVEVELSPVSGIFPSKPILLLWSGKGHSNKKKGVPNNLVSLQMSLVYHWVHAVNFREGFIYEFKTGYHK